jgi:hypothetical protein
MRQVNRDELTYVIYSAMRGWTITLRKRVFNRHSNMQERDRELAAAMIADKLRYLEIFGGEGAPLDQEGVAGAMARGIAAFPGAIGQLWTSGIAARHDEARKAAAQLLCTALEPYHVLSPAPLSDQVGFPALIAPAHALASKWP